MASLKRNILVVGKSLGLFALASFFYRERLNILCYHGFSYADEYAFRPSMFMRAETFKKRVDFIRDKGYQVFPLEEGLTRLRERSLPRKSLVVTIDDGFRSVLDLAVPILTEADVPATLYVTTYYVDKPGPVFRLLIQYLAWKSGDEVVVAEMIRLLSTQPDSDMMQLIEIAERTLSERQRVELSRDLTRRLGIDYDQLIRDGITCLADRDQVAKMHASGIDIQLHTHRHVLPTDAEGVAREISENRNILAEITGKNLTHFCYPSGYHAPEHLQPLKALGVTSATTCIPGLNKAGDDWLTLKRFLDYDDLDMLEFEAELSGFTELLRRAKSIFIKNKG